MDRNLKNHIFFHQSLKSLSARRAWIEIVRRTVPTDPIFVALRKESVDRNRPAQALPPGYPVALRKESVDRNIALVRPSRAANVALRKESVDRNIQGKSINVKSRSRSPQGERG